MLRDPRHGRRVSRRSGWQHEARVFASRPQRSSGAHRFHRQFHENDRCQSVGRRRRRVVPEDRAALLLRRIAERRSVDVSKRAGMQHILGTANYLYIDDAISIDAHERRTGLFRIGPLTLRVDIRDWYVYLMKTYRLPCRVIQQNFIRTNGDGGDGSDSSGGRDAASRRRLQNLLNDAFAGALGKTTENGGALSHDILELDSFGRRIDTAGSASAVGSVVRDEYYDVDVMTGASDSGRVEDTQRSMAADMARDIAASVASSEDRNAFYPFVIWPWISGKNDSCRIFRRPTAS